MGVYILPDAQQDLLDLQAYMLDKWSEAVWLQAEDELFDKLALVDSGVLTGPPIEELACVGILDYQCVFTSHHKLVYRRVEAEVYVYAVAHQRQDFPALLSKRMFKL